MGKREHGVSLGGLLMILFIVVVVGIFGLKLVPAYIEYYKIKAAVVAIAGDRSKSSSVSEIRRAFDARANIDDINSIKSSDLDVTKEGGDVVISFEYPKIVPLAGNVSLYVNFKGSSKGD